MMRQQLQHAMTYRYRLNSQRILLTALILLACFILAGCQTVQPTNSTLKDMQEWATPEPLDRLSPPREQRRAKAAMVKWLEQYLKQEYRVMGQHYVLTQPGSTASASIGSKAHQFATQKLAGVPRPDTWLDDDNYSLMFWTLSDTKPRYIAFVMTNDFLPGTDERSLVGYFELSLKAKPQKK
jgi:hypothetical protein